jgi:hypothetical protein
MKFSLEIAYILGWWHVRKINNPTGVGITGSKAPEFKEWVKKYLMQNHKYREIGDFIENRWAYRTLKHYEDDRLHRFQYLNDYSATYFAAVWEASDKKIFGDDIDLILLQKLGFFGEKRGNRIKVKKDLLFRKYISKYLGFLSNNQNSQ